MELDKFDAFMSEIVGKPPVETFKHGTRLLLQEHSILDRLPGLRRNPNCRLFTLHNQQGTKEVVIQGSDFLPR